jgi:hypothetical protein
MIGFMPLLTVSGILQTHPGWHGSGPGTLPLGESLPLSPSHACSSMRTDATSATAPGPSCGRARCRPFRARQARAGRVITSITAPGALCGQEQCRPPRVSQAQAGWSSPLPLATAPCAAGAVLTVQGAAGSWSRACLWHV